MSASQPRAAPTSVGAGAATAEFQDQNLGRLGLSLERLRSILCAQSPSEAAPEMPPYLSFQLQNHVLTFRHSYFYTAQIPLPPPFRP